MDRQSETVELFETFAVEEIGTEVRPYLGYGYDCYWCYYGKF